jgi:phosphate ABC transporter permease protein PstC
VATQSPEIPANAIEAARRARRLERKEQAAHVAFASLAAASLVVIALIAVYVFRQAWPSFEANGVSWFGNSADPTLDRELAWAFTGNPPGVPYRELHAWPAIYGTLLTSGGAILLAFVFSVLSSIFIAELAPRWLARLVEPVVRILAAVPSVVWGLFGLLALAPLIEQHLVSDDLANRYSSVVPLQGPSVLLGTLVLTLMITPFMISIFTDALRAVPPAWRDGARALGMSPWRTTLKISLPVIRSALVAGTVLATGRAVGEAIMLSMTTGALAFVPNPLDGAAFFLEPVRPLASALVDYSEGIDDPILASNLFAFGAVILTTALALMLAARLITRPLRERSAGTYI